VASALYPAPSTWRVPEVSALPVRNKVKAGAGRREGTRGNMIVMISVSVVSHRSRLKFRFCVHGNVEWLAWAAYTLAKR
jgi:hypothetical protein